MSWNYFQQNYKNIDECVSLFKFFLLFIAFAAYDVKEMFQAQSARAERAEHARRAKRPARAKHAEKHFLLSFNMQICSTLHFYNRYLN